MSSSTLPSLSLLAKGIGQTVSNGHEKLEVYLEPKDYYNLKSGSFGRLATIQQRKNNQFHLREDDLRPANVHKTFVTRKGALLIFSEELANKALKEEAKELYNKHPVKVSDKRDLKLKGYNFQEEHVDEDPLRTVHDLRVAILMYGNEPQYRKKGDELYLRFVHNARAPHDERFIRPGFSPNRYMTAWSKLWHQEMLKKLQRGGLVQSTSLNRKDPVLSQFYHHDGYNLSRNPPPYRVTRNMLHAWDGTSSDYQRTHRLKALSDSGHHDELLSTKMKHVADKEAANRQKPEEAIPIKSIQAVRFLESGEVEEVKYNELKQHEKQEILAELLATAWEHGKHIEQMLDLVLSSNKQRPSSGASSSAESELMMDMHKAILSLAESPIQRQIREKRAQKEKLKHSKSKAKEERARKEGRHRKHESQEMPKRDKRTKKETDAEAQVNAAQELDKEREQRRAARAARHQERERARKEKEAERELRKERELQKEKEREERRRERHMEKERRAEEKREAKRRALEKARMEEELHERRHHEINSIHDGEKENSKIDSKDQRRDERKRHRDQGQQYNESPTHQISHSEIKREKYHQDATVSQPQPPRVHVGKRESKRMRIQETHQNNTAGDGIESTYDHRVGDHIERTSVKSHATTVSEGAPVHAAPSQGYTPKSRPTLQVPQNTPATEPRKTRVQRQLPLENVIYEARSKRSHASSSTASSLKSSKKTLPVYHTPTVISSGDGQYATYHEPKKHATKLKPIKKVRDERTVTPEPFYVEKEPSHVSSRKSSLVFSVNIPGQHSGKSSFYGGAMPISSNIVKQTLSDKISILSASQDYSAPSESMHEVGISGTNAHLISQTDRMNDPSVSDENSSMTKKSSTTAKKSSHTMTISSHTTSDPKRKPKIHEFSESEDEQVDSSSHLTYSIMKGLKGPGSQSSAAFSKGETKKSLILSRGNVPHELLNQKHAAIYMPDKRIVDVRALPPQSSSEDSGPESVKDDKISSDTEQQKSVKSSQAASSDSERPTKAEAKVTFEKALTEKSEDTESEETMSEESEKSEQGWPPAEESRPISSRSAKLTGHAQKVAEMVVKIQRPDSQLGEDAMRAAEMWNKISSKGSTDGSASDVTSVDDVETESSQWNAAGIEEKLDKDSIKSSSKDASVAHTKSKKSSVKSVDASVKSTKTASSRKTSVSSAQEAFIYEVKRKASELGIDEKELQFEPELVQKVYASTVDPEEVEVFHDIDEGKHVVRSRHSSITTKSHRTDRTSDSESKRKQFVVDVPSENKTSDRPETASTDSSTVSPVSSRLRKLSHGSSTHSALTKSSIPVSNDNVALKYDVTSYEKKEQPETKHEASAVVAKDRKREPENLDRIAAKKKKEKQSVTKKPESQKTQDKSSKPDATGSLENKAKEEQTSKAVHAKADKSEEEKSLESKSMKKMRIKKGQEKQAKDSNKKDERMSAEPTPSPVKQKVKTPEPFTAGRAKDEKAPKGLQSPPKPDPKPVKQKKEKVKSPKQEASKPKSKTTKPKMTEKVPEADPEPPTPATAEIKVKTPEPEVLPTKAPTPEVKSDDEDDRLSSIPSQTPEDDYQFVRVEETPVPSEPEEEPIPEPEINQNLDDAKSLASDKTAPTEATAETDNSEELLRAAEEEEARLAKKREKDEKRAAAADKRRLEVERKRKEKEEQARREKEELEKQEAMREELEKEQRRRLEEMKRRKAEAEQARLRELEEEEARKKREEQQREREKRMQEEHKRKLEEIQKKKREEELRKAEEARLKALEEQEALEREKEMLAQMAEEEVLEYQRRKQEELEEQKRREEQRRLEEEEKARIMMEEARRQAFIMAKEKAAYAEKMKFIRNLKIQANEMDHTQNMTWAFEFSYFELLNLLGLDFSDPDLE